MAPSQRPLPEESLGARIRRLRDALDLTQVELASSIGVAIQTNGRSRASKTITDWESDRVTPAPRMQRMLARTFGVSLDYLMTGEGSDEPVAPATTRERLLDIETQLGDHAQRIAHLEAPDRRQGNRMRDEGKIETEISELRVALTALTNSYGELASKLLAAQEQLQELEGQRGADSARGGEPRQP